MKLIFDRDTLIAAVTPLMGTVSTKNTIAAVEGILLESKGNNLCVLSSYDLEKGMRTEVEARVEEGGSYILNANKFSAILRTMPEGELTVEINDHNVTKISGGASSFELHALNGKDFPNLPELQLDRGIRLKQGDLKDMIVSTAFAVAQNDSRPALNGALLRVQGNTVTMVSCDGNRMALKEKKCDVVSIDETEVSVKCIVPGKALNEIVRLLTNAEEPLSVKVTGKHMILKTEKFYLFTRLIEEEYVDYERFIPKTSKVFVNVGCDAFIRSLERAALVTEDRTMGQSKSPLVCTFEENLLKISSESINGKVYDEIVVEKTGEDISIGFNCKYLLDLLRSCDCANLRLALTTPLMGMTVQPAEDNEDDTFLFMILPVRMKG